MRWPLRRPIRKGAAWLRSRFRDRALILGYHRIDPPRDDPFNLSVSPETFRAHLASVLEFARPGRLGDVMRGLRTGALESGSVAFTFDDAHAGTMLVLEPMLREMEIPATIFVPTGLLGQEPWWERLHRVLSGASRLPRELDIRTGALVLRRHLDDSERERPSRGGRSRLVTEVYQALRPLPDEERAAFLAELEKWAGDERLPVARVVTTGELVDLDGSTWLDIGSHSVTHPVLTNLPEERQRSEIESSRRVLEDILGHDVDLFSYPNGARTRSTDRLVKEAGYVGACASQPDVVTSATDPYALPRFWPGDDAGEVERVLRHWVGRP